jgi:serine/threonine protein kinase
MSPETLLGVELGQSVLQRLLGQGTMGTVYLAYHARLQRQVAIKVFLSAFILEKAEHDEFQKRLKEEIALAATLEHTHILAILDHGEEKGLVYEMMPYIAGESLQSLLDRSGRLPFAQIQRYLEQLAAALDYAHARNILHRDIKPGNILLSPTGNLLLADFGVAGLTTEKNFAHARQPMPGMLNYIAPEYVLGQTIDQSADLYSLGVVLYQMVTGVPPFQSTSLSETAIKHVKALPASPCSLRKDLPGAAEQVLLRALAKRPTNRYSHAQDLASAFRFALEPEQPLPAKNQTTSALALLADLASGGATTKIPRISAPPSNHPYPQTQMTEQITHASTRSQSRNDFQRGAESLAPTLAAPGTKRTGLLSFANFQATSEQPVLQNHASQEPGADSSLRLENKPVGDTEELRNALPAKKQNTTDLLTALSIMPNSGVNTGTVKLTEPVKIVTVPVAGQPGRFITGFLPLHLAEQDKEITRKRGSRHIKIFALLLAILVVTTGSGLFFWSTHTHNNPVVQSVAQPTANLSASATAQATATIGANIILSDNLSQNIHNWPVGKQGNIAYTFKNGAYHIANNDKNQSAPALLPDKVITGPFAYSLTMEQIKGDETSPNNQFGMILYATIQNANSKQIAKFYAFEVLNKANGQYQFWKYDNSKTGTNSWTSLWTKNFGKEFLQGSGSSYMNTFKIIADGKMFTFFVNGKQVGTWKDSSFSSGRVGMLVNLDGAEVAFSNLLLTHS